MSCERCGCEVHSRDNELNPFCVYCWPSLVPADHIVQGTGLPCCSACMRRADGQPTIPSFALRHHAPGELP